MFSPAVADGALGSLRISQVAAVAGLPVRTVRYYESLGLLKPTVQRSESSYRLFHPAVLGRLAFIRRCQSLGLSLEEIRQILQLYDRGEQPCPEIRQHLQEKLWQIEERMAELQTLKGQIESLLSDWRIPAEPTAQEDVICPILQKPEAGGDKVGRRYSTVTDLARLRG
ncbi:transcriptional regulator [Synechococcus sp. 63AY4M2]|jgi:DNA-binding transcriptional MerR regulator|uniref:heavy metal-responsive transcriptional regulator n=1 Tax=unclassified Synechococcus TaxID=2626047 RepID=UPI0002DE410E|nr:MULTISPECIES: heavy metal-responsive transcriptional regulator [unclassified Synechococcus]PIK87313.1 transcriptional regulator [Synechococcus sp. 63AY4M2]PIK88264.1 transcriptional regulator [Synechococcus sp. 65AY6A5]PIK92701.1 transcriptional regulator [Synechococcus sp. 65AY6Li]PIK98643.1 transcriptional regulator [Synechococcus sp. 63AY4M1]PIL00632.1 transcriptional regulator [Synechococcus sp. 65AY640]